MAGCTEVDPKVRQVLRCCHDIGIENLAQQKNFHYVTPFSFMLVLRASELAEPFIRI